MRSPRRISLLRGFVGATLATFVALASHVWVGGAMPGMLGIAIPWLLSFLVCTLLSGIRLSITRLTLAVVLSQALFHALFVLGAIAPSGGFAPHQHGALVLASSDSLPDAGQLALLPPDAGMWAAHAAAAACTALALHRGERLLLALASLASGIVRWLSRAVYTAPSLPAVPARIRWVVRAAPHRPAPLLSALRRRGPPLHIV